ncbi:putative inactive shikimate kinase like 2 [Cucumis melo var. makuwa]|uniref:Inactive shikimate kinase like 2 n=1 Tax=Cucumis melo var. makuwa TaxID=1194695 RepID=A0A5A7UCT5_CUCMM|nr:putative inactive shikimate kinase like 2 [Cucumis melo var. makuwa]
MASTSFTSALCFFSQNPIRNLQFSSPISSSSSSGVAFSSISTALTSCSSLSPSNSRFSSRFTRNCSSSTAPVRTLDYEVLPLLQNDRIVNCVSTSCFLLTLSKDVFPIHPASGVAFYPILTGRKFVQFTDSSSEVELRLQLGTQDIRSSKDVYVDANETSLTIRVQRLGSIITLLETKQLFEKIKPAETIWYIDEDQLVINLKKHDPDLKWPDIVESWESLTAGSTQLLKGTSIFLIGDSTDINQKVAHELAVGLGYTPLSTKELLETFSKQTIDSWMLAEGSNAVAQAENTVIESLSSHVRAVVATLGGRLGAAGRTDTWRHLYAGFTVWLSQTEATDESAAKEEAKRHMQDSQLAYSNAEVVVKLQGWDDAHSKVVAQAALSALKQLILSDKNLPDKKSLYIRLGCRGDWPNIKPPGWDPASDGITNTGT